MGKRHRRNRRWTDGQRRNLEKATAAGKLEAVTGAKIGRSEGAVRAKRDRLRLPRDPTDPRQNLLPGLACEGGGE